MIQKIHRHLRPGQTDSFAELVFELRNVNRLAAGYAAAAGTVLRRQDPLGLPGYDVVCPPDQALAWWERLRAAGAKPAGSLAANVLRIEAGRSAAR